MQIENNNAQIKIESQNVQSTKEENINEDENINNNEQMAEINVNISGSERNAQEHLEIEEHSEKNLIISQENIKNENGEMGIGDEAHSRNMVEGDEENGDEIHHENGDEINQLHQEGENIADKEENLEHLEQYYEADGEEGEEENNDEGMLQEEEEHMDENNGEEFIHEENVEENNDEAEEMNFDDNEEENGEYENDNMEEQNEERDTMQKTLTQNIGEDVMQIPEQPIHVFYDPENFCDYEP